MGKKLAIILSALLILTVAVVIEAVLYLKHQRAVLSDLAVEKSGDLPLELSVNFDPTQNSPRFMIESVDRQAKTFNLKSVWPPTFDMQDPQSAVFAFIIHADEPAAKAQCPLSDHNSSIGRTNHRTVHLPRLRTLVG